MRWKITIEGMDELGGCEAAEMVIEKEFSRLAKGEIGLDALRWQDDHGLPAAACGQTAM